MKILQVIDRLNVGGAERVMVDMSNILHENKQDVSVLFILYPGPLANQLNPNIPRIILNRKSKFSLKTYYQCAQYLGQFDIIHCHSRYNYSYIRLTNFLFRKKRKIVLHDHYGPIDIDQSIPFLFEWIFKPNYYIGVSQTLTNWARNQLKLAESNVFLLHNIIRKRYAGKACKKYDLILVSNIKSIKNQLFAIALAKKLNRKLLIIGQNQDDAYYKQVKETIEGTQVELLTDCDDTHIYIAQSQFALHVSPSETGPLALIEYMAYGIPFLTFETGEVAASCKHEFPDMVIQNFDLEDWEERINKITTENNIALSERLMTFYSTHFSEQSYFTKCQKIYNHISHDSSL
jgi:glycosyltransferase involved in cell wall biosynthesis